MGDFYDSLAAAFAKVEGFYPGSRAYRNNNPGNLRDVRRPDGRWSIWPSLPHDAGGFPQFASAADGWAALKRDLQIKAGRGLTLEQAISQYAPPSENDTAAYIRNVSASLGVASDVPLSTLAAGGYAAQSEQGPRLSLAQAAGLEDVDIGLAAVAAVSGLWLLLA